MRAIDLLLLALLLAVPARADDDAIRARGRALCAQWIAGDDAAIVAQMTHVTLRMMRGEESFTTFSRSVRAEIGAEGEVLSETVRQDDGYAVYRRTSRFANAPNPHTLEWAINDAGKVVGFAITDTPDAPPPEPAPSTNDLPDHVPREADGRSPAGNT